MKRKILFLWIFSITIFLSGTICIIAQPDTDFDGDGLTNAEEAELGTNPYLSDTDFDGYTDYEEYIVGSDPLDYQSTPLSLTAGLPSMGEIIAYFLSVISGIFVGVLIVRKVTKHKGGKKKHLFAEHTQSLTLAIVSTTVATVIGYISTLVDSPVLSFMFLLILLFLLGMSLTLFFVVAYYLYKK